MTNVVEIDRLWQVYTGMIRNGATLGSLFALLFGTLVLWLVFRIIPLQSEKNRLRGRPLLPPGRFGLPVIGETLNFFSALRNNRLGDFLQTREEKYGRVFKTSLMLTQTVCLPAPAGNKFVFANENKLFQNRWPDSALTLLGKEVFSHGTPDSHRRIRRILMTFFSPESLESFVPRMDVLAAAHISKHWENQDQVTGSKCLKQFAFVLSCDLFLSLKEGPELDKLFEAFNVMLEGLRNLPFDIPGTRFWKAKRARQILLSGLVAITTRRRQELKDKRASPRQDLLSVLLTTADENEQFLSEEAIYDNLIVLLFAGHETTASALSTTLRLLAENPTCVNEMLKELRRIAAEREPGVGVNWTDTRHMEYTWRVIQESMRIVPVVPLVFREAITDFEFDGFTIPKGWKVMYSSFRSNMVPEYFPEPHKFDPSRFQGIAPPQYTFVPFGGGLHSCPGAEFARLEMLVFLDQLVRRVQWSLVDPNEELTIDPLPCMKKGLLLKIAKRVQT